MRKRSRVASCLSGPGIAAGTSRGIAASPLDEGFANNLALAHCSDDSHAAARSTVEVEEATLSPDVRSTRYSGNEKKPVGGRCAVTFSK